MTSLYKILKSAKLGAGAAQDFHTAIMAQKMPFAKRSGAEHEYTGAVPVTFTANGQPLLDYLISGNTVQNGTPTPDSPIMPQGTGERTGNLFDINRTVSTSFTTNTNYYMYGAFANNTVLSPVYADITITNGILTVRSKAGGCGAGFLVEVNPNTTYTLSFDTDKTVTGSYFGFNILTANLEMLGYVAVRYKTYTFTTDANTKYAYFVFRIPPNDGIVQYSNIVLNEGSTALPYEPYGYKIPISSNSTTTPVYLGEVETTRKIKKYEFTGQESIVAHLGYSRFYFTLNDSLIIGVRKTPAFCTHWQVIDDGRPIENVPNNALYSDSGNSRWFIKTTDYTTADDFKAYLTQQYAAGTPVCVWYVLTNEETGIVNEPLMKIGDYADTVSMEQAGVEIPTARGTNTLDVLTDVKPSEIYIKYKE